MKMDDNTKGKERINYKLNNNDNKKGSVKIR